jgi:hypothetical protein
VTTFALQLGDFANKTKQQANIIFRKTALELHSRVVEKTPVDTGIARSNWQAGVSVAPVGTVNVIDKGSLGSPPNSVNASAAKAAINSFELGQTIYVVNNLPYIKVLEFGRDNGTAGSIQAPNGMVRITVAEFPNIVSTVVNETTK